MLQLKVYSDHMTDPKPLSSIKHCDKMHGQDLDSPKLFALKPRREQLPNTPLTNLCSLHHV